MDERTIRYANCLGIVFHIDALCFASPLAVGSCRSKAFRDPRGPQRVTAWMGDSWPDLGFFWRYVLVMTVLEGISFAFKLHQLTSPIAVLSLGLLSGIAYSFFASAWLVNHQIGTTTIEFTTNLMDEVHHMNSSDQSAMETTKRGIVSILSTGAVVSYFAIGLVQLAAVFTFFEDYWGWWTIPSIMVGLFVAYMPVVGSIAGFLAAIEVWHWKWHWAALVFFFPVVLAFISAAIGGISSMLRR